MFGNENISQKTFKFYLKMNKTTFIKRFGDEQHRVAKNYAKKALSTNYGAPDAFVEYCDNSYDSRIEGETTVVEIKTNDDAKTITIIDNGSGVANAEKLFELGGTDKEKDAKKIGKYGVGFLGATSCIAKSYVYDEDDMVEITITSARNGKKFEKHAAFDKDGELIIGHTVYDDCDTDIHYTKIIISNVLVKDKTSIIDKLEEVFEETFEMGLTIKFDDRELGQSFSDRRKTFTGEEEMEFVNVGNQQVGVKYRIIGGDVRRGKSRSFEETALRVYDKNSRRLLAKSKELWDWLGGKQAQQNICGLRAAIYIDSSIESYTTFGIKAAKNGIQYKQYFKRPEFKLLSQKLRDIYNRASKNNPGLDEIHVIPYGDKEFCVFPKIPSNKASKLYWEMGTNSYGIKKNYNTKEVASMICQIINLTNELVALQKSQNIVVVSKTSK